MWPKAERTLGNMADKQEKTMGSLVGAIRRERGWTLKQMSEAVQIPLSTLAKVESDKLSLSYDKLQMLTQRLGVSMADFFSQTRDETGSPKAVIGRRSLAALATTVNIETQNYVYRYLCVDLTHKRMVPILVDVKARSLEEFGDPVSHPGEEFLYVLEGEIQIHLEFYAPMVLRAGEGIYIDSQMRHAYTLGNCDKASLLAVCSGDEPDLEATLVRLGEASSKR